MKPIARHTQLNRAHPIQFLDKPEELLEKEKSIILEIYFASGLTDKEWETMAIPAILNLAKYVELLPASTAHHHSEEGGLFRHSLETALTGLRIARNSVLSRVGTHAEVNFARTFWNNAAFLGGLLHDIGKVVSNFAVFNLEDHTRWQPLKESLWEWGLRTGVKEYAVISLLSNDFADTQDPFGSQEAKRVLASALRCDEHEEFSRTLAPRLVPETYIAWFQKVQTEDVLKVLYQSLSTQSAGVNDLLRKCIQKADGISTSNYVKTHTDFPASESSLNIVAVFLDGVRFALNKRFWKVNKPGAEVFVLENKCFIDWNRVALNPLAAFLETNKHNSGFIRKKEELAKWLIDNGLAHANRKYSPEGELRETPFFTIHPLCLTSATRAVWLTKSPFMGLVPSVAGSILDCTDVPSKDADDIFLTDASDNPEHAEKIVSSAQKIRESEETEIFNKSRSHTTEKFDSEKVSKVKERNSARREGFSKIRPIRTAATLLDSILKIFGYARFVDAEVVRETTIENDLTVRSQSAVEKKRRDNKTHPDNDNVIRQGVSEEFATKKIWFSKEDIRYFHPEVMDSAPLFYSGQGWKTYEKFPKLPRFSESAFIEEGEESNQEGIPPILKSAPSFADFRNKNTNKFLWKYYPFADKLAAFTSKENFDSVSFSDAEDSVQLKEKLRAFFKEELVPSEIFPAPEPVKAEKCDEDGVVDREAPQVRTPDFEKNGSVIAGYVSFYRKALLNFKIGRSAGCFPPEFRDSEFYPFFVELAALFLNNVKCSSIDGVLPVSLVEVNRTSVRVNAWMLLSARFRAVCRVSPQSDEEDPAYLLATRVEKFLKPAVQVFRYSFQTDRQPDAKEKDTALPADFAVIFTDDLTVAAVNFLIREHRTNRYRDDEESSFSELFEITNKGKLKEAAVQDRVFGREGMARIDEPTPPSKPSSKDSIVEAARESINSQSGSQGEEAEQSQSNSASSTTSTTPISSGGSDRVGNSNGSDTAAEAPKSESRGEGEESGEEEGKGGDKSTEGKNFPSSNNEVIKAVNEKAALRKTANNNESPVEETAFGNNAETSENSETPEVPAPGSTSAQTNDENGQRTPPSGDSSYQPPSQGESPCEEHPVIKGESEKREESKETQETQGFSDPITFLRVLAGEMEAGGGTLITADDITYVEKKGMKIYSLSLEKFRELIIQAGLEYGAVFAALPTCGRRIYFQGGNAVSFAQKIKPLSSGSPE